MVSITEIRIPNNNTKIYLPKTIAKRLRRACIQLSPDGLKFKQLIRDSYNNIPNDILEKITKPETCSCDKNIINILFDLLKKTLSYN